MSIPGTLADMRAKFRSITGLKSPTQITDAQIDKRINTVYLFDFPEHLKLISLRYNYQFTTTANRPVYDLPTDTYFTGLPPVYIGGYQSFMTQSRENFFRINPQLNFQQVQIYTGNGTTGPYTGQSLTQTPVIPGFKPNPPGAYVANAANQLSASLLNWNVIVSAQAAADPTSGISQSLTLVDDGLGNLVDVNDPGTTGGTGFVYRGTVNYITGALSINATGFTSAVPSGNAITVQYIPYVASRPQSVIFFQDQFILYPVPDQAYTVSFEAYKTPTALIQGGSPSQVAQVREWWQALAVGAALKFFEDNEDMENYMKYRPFFDEYLTLVARRTIVQQTAERTATIYTEQDQFPQFPFGNVFGGF